MYRIMGDWMGLLMDALIIDVALVIGVCKVY